MEEEVLSEIEEEEEVLAEVEVEEEAKAEVLLTIMDAEETRCGHQLQERCPASGQTCSYCHQLGYFKAANFNLKSQRVEEVDFQENSVPQDVDNFWLEFVEIIKEGNMAWYH